MPRNKKKAAKKDETRYDLLRAFQEMRGIITKQHKARLKFLESVARKVFAELDEPVWLSAGFLKQAREESGLTQEELEKASGISRVIIAQYETGSRPPTIENAHAIYSALEKSSSTSVFATNGLRFSVEFSRAVSIATLEMLRNEIKMSTERYDAVEVLIPDYNAEILRLDQKAAGNVTKSGWGR
jgi:transcriptional regulator with XRE-family HTH domain